MSSNGNGKNGNNKWAKIGSESAGFGVAEILSEGVWLGLVAVEDYLIPKRLLKSVSKAVANVCIEPFLDPIEKGLNAVCKLDECKPDPKKSRAERAEQLAKAIIMYGPPIVIAWETKVLARRFMNKKMGLPPESEGGFFKWSPQEKMIFLSDEGMHLGALYLLNNQLAPHTEEMIHATKGVIKKVFNTSDEKAHELSSAVWIWGAPNVVGAAGGMMAITGKHLKDWPKGLIGKLLGRSDHLPS